MNTESQPFRVLSLDGGGMRGTYTATYLDQVADAFAKRRAISSLDIGAAFDLIVGTSTGGIVACALAVGIPLSEVTELYVKHGPRIFTRTLPTGIGGAITDICMRPKALAAGTEALRAALESKFGETTLGQIYAERRIALAITAIEMGQHRGWVFKTPHLKETTNHRDDHYKLVNVCLGTSAAPIYRSMAAINHPEGNGGGYNVFVDGGLWANNPVLVGLIDALEMTAPGQEIHIFCLGTCSLPAGERIDRSSVNRGLAQWKFGGDAASLAVDAQQFTFDHMAKKIARHVDRRCSIVRFPSEQVPTALIPCLGLDDTREEAMQALINQARTDADMTNSKCAYADVDGDAELIRSLFNSMPERADPSDEGTTITGRRSGVAQPTILR